MVNSWLSLKRGAAVALRYATYSSQCLVPPICINFGHAGRNVLAGRVIDRGFAIRRAFLRLTLAPKPLLAEGRRPIPRYVVSEAVHGPSNVYQSFRSLVQNHFHLTELPYNPWLLARSRFVLSSSPHMPPVLGKPSNLGLFGGTLGQLDNMKTETATVRHLWRAKAT
jgi:hypothetical protein